MKSNKEMIVYLSDLHIPFEDKPKIRKILEYIKTNKPSMVILGGDIVDFYDLSTFDKEKHNFSIQDEINKLHIFLNDLRNIHKGRIVYLEGNHEYRIYKYLMRHPELSSISRINSVSNFLELNNYNVEYKIEFIHRNYIFKHGDSIGNNSSLSELKRESMNGMCGHQHSTNISTINCRNGTIRWDSVGHLCNPKIIDYTRDSSVRHTWNSGFGVVTFFGDGVNEVNNVIFKEGKFVINGKVY